MTTTKTTIMNVKDFKELDQSGSSLIFECKYYDCLNYVDVKKLRSKFSKELYNKKIKQILALTQNYIKKQNKDIEYKYPVFCEDRLEGSQYNEEWRAYTTNYPYGDVIVLTKTKE